MHLTGLNKLLQFYEPHRCTSVLGSCLDDTIMSQAHSCLEIQCLHWSCVTISIKLELLTWSFSKLQIKKYHHHYNYNHHWLNVLWGYMCKYYFWVFIVLPPLSFMSSNIGMATIHYFPCIREEIRSTSEHVLMLIENTQVGIQNWLVYITVPKW